MRRLFVFDLDGTLIFGGRPLNPSLEEALARLAASGAQLVFATARSRRGVRSVLPAWCLEGLIIFCNGAFAELDGRRIAESTLDPIVGERLRERLEAAGVAYVMEMGDFYYHRAGDHPYYKDLAREGPGELSHDPPLSGRGLYKITALAAAESEVMNAITYGLDPKTVQVIAHGDGSSDFLAPGCSKWHCLALALPKEHLGSMVVFGNDRNDRELFEHGSRCVAVGDGCPELLASAHEVIPSTSAAVRKHIIEILG